MHGFPTITFQKPHSFWVLHCWNSASPPSWNNHQPETYTILTGNISTQNTELMTPIGLTVHQDAEYSKEGSVDWNETLLLSSPTFYLEHCCQHYFRSIVLFSCGPFKVPEDGNSAASLCNLLQHCTTPFKHTFPLISKLHLPSFYMWPQLPLNLSVQPRSLAPSVSYLFSKRL